MVYISTIRPTRTYCIAHGTLPNVTRQPGWEEHLGENGYMYMYGCSQKHPLWLFQIRSYYMYLLGHISDKELNSIFVSSEEMKTGS